MGNTIWRTRLEETCRRFHLHFRQNGISLSKWCGRWNYRRPCWSYRSGCIRMYKYQDAYIDKRLPWYFLLTGLEYQKVIFLELPFPHFLRHDKRRQVSSNLVSHIVLRWFFARPLAFRSDGLTHSPRLNGYFYGLNWMDIYGLNWIIYIQIKLNEYIPSKLNWYWAIELNKYRNI